MRALTTNLRHRHVYSRRQRPIVNHVLIPVIVHLTEGYNVSETRLQLLPERLGVIRRYLQVGFPDFVRVPDVPFLG